MPRLQIALLGATFVIAMVVYAWFFMIVFDQGLGVAAASAVAPAIISVGAVYWQLRNRRG